MKNVNPAIKAAARTMGNDRYRTCVSDEEIAQRIVRAYLDEVERRGQRES